MKTVMNPPYCPHYNGIELVWNVAKLMYRKWITEKKLKFEKWDNNQLVRAIIHNIPPETVRRCAHKGWQALFESSYQS